MLNQRPGAEVQQVGNIQVGQDVVLSTQSVIDGNPLLGYDRMKKLARRC